MNRMTMLARYGLLPAALAADVAIAWTPLTEPVLSSVHFGLGYATIVAMILGFRRRSAVGSAGLLAIALTVIWAVGLRADGLVHLAASLAGLVCGMIPAAVREWQRLAGDDVYMQLGELRRLWRRRRANPPVHWPSSGRPVRQLAVPAPEPERAHELATGRDRDR